MLPEPYYHDDVSDITIYCGDCREILTQLEPGSVDLVLTDPPYSSSTHDGARNNPKSTPLTIDFEPVLGNDWIETVAPLARRWVVATMDWRHIARSEQCPPAGLRFVRFGVWAKTNGAPQFTGDRPAPGWEGVAFLHRDGGRMAWNGGGRSSVWTGPIVQGDHPTQKPIWLLREWVQLFSNPGDLIPDPFMGSGTTLRAAKDLGRRAIGIELEERYCEIAVRRLQQSVLPLEGIA